MKVMIVLVADDVVPEPPLPDSYIAPDVMGLFIPVGEAEFDGLHESEMVGLLLMSIRGVR